MANIIPEYLLCDPSLLAVYCYLLRKVRPEPVKVKVSGSIVSLKSYELSESLQEVSLRTGLSEDVVEGAFDELVALELVGLEAEEGQYRIKFQHLVLPASEHSRGPSEIIDYEDCWLEDFVFDYLEHVNTNLAPKTYQNAARVMNLFQNFVGRKKLSSLAAEDLEEYKRHRKGKVMDTTINMDVRTLKAAMEVAVKLGRIASNPFRSVKQIRGTKKQICPLTKEEFTTLCSRIVEPWLIDIIQIAVLTGLRRGEIMNLRWKDVDLETRQITVQSSEEYRVKHGKTRVLPVNEQAAELLKRQERSSEWVFLNEEGERLKDDFVSKKFKSYLRMLGLPEELHFHSLRATCASWSLKEGIPIYAVKTLLGHASVKTTEIYTSYDRESLREHVEKISLP